MGLDDRMREAERAKALQDAESARNMQITLDRQTLADQRLKALALETLDVVRNRDFPRAIEITSITRKDTFLGGVKHTINTGRKLWLVQKNYSFGQGIMACVGLLDSAEFVSIQTAEYGVNATTSNESHVEVRLVREAAQRAGCAAAVKNVKLMSPRVEQPAEHQGQLFWLNNRRELIYGGWGSSTPADEWIANQLVG